MVVVEGNASVSVTLFPLLRSGNSKLFPGIIRVQEIFNQGGILADLWRESVFWAVQVDVEDVKSSRLDFEDLALQIRAVAL